LVRRVQLGRRWRHGVLGRPQGADVRRLHDAIAEAARALPAAAPRYDLRCHRQVVGGVSRMAPSLPLAAVALVRGPVHEILVTPGPDRMDLEVVGDFAALPPPDAPDRRRAAALAQEPSRLLAQELQLVAEIEIHAASSYAADLPLISRSKPPRSAASCRSLEGLQRAP